MKRKTTIIWLAKFELFEIGDHTRNDDTSDFLLSTEEFTYCSEVRRLAITE